MVWLEGGQGEVSGASPPPPPRANHEGLVPTPPHTTPKCPTWTPPPTDPPDCPPPHRPSLTPPPPRGLRPTSTWGRKVRRPPPPPGGLWSCVQKRANQIHPSTCLPRPMTARTFRALQLKAKSKVRPSPPPPPASWQRRQGMASGVHQKGRHFPPQKTIFSAMPCSL